MATLNDLLVTGSARFVNTIQGNITTALTAAVANSVAWGNITGKPSSFTPSSHNHTYLSGWGDTRSTATAPNDYNSKLAVVGIKTPTASGTLDGSSYATLMGIRGWSDSSGGNTHELAFTGNGALYHRHGATTSWNAWKRIPFGDGDGASGNWGINVTGSSASCTGNAATASILKGVTSSGAVPIAGLTAGYIKYFYNVNTGLTGNMPTSSNANGILQLNTHSGNYHHQLGFSSDGNIYHRASNGVALANEMAWSPLLTSDNYENYMKINKLLLPEQIATQAALDGFLSPLEFRVGYWNGFTPTGLISNGFIISNGWTSDTYGYQIAIDDDPTYKIYLRQKSTSWSDWKMLPMADGTNASGDWDINITGIASQASRDEGGNDLYDYYYHRGNIIYSADEPANPVQGMIWLQPV